MILKMIYRSADGKHESCEYIDNIRSAQVSYDEEIGRNCILAYIGESNDGCVFPVNCVAYLMNDRGNTIDRIYGENRSEYAKGNLERNAEQKG